MFGSVAEEIIRMAHDKLIEWRRRSDHHRAGASVASASSACPLQRSGDGSGVARHHYRVERSHVDPEFQRARAYDAADAAIAQAALDFAAFIRQISAAVAANCSLLARGLGICFLQIG